MAIHSDKLQGSIRIRFSFIDTYMGRQLHPSGRQGNTIRMKSLIRQDVEKNCNCSDARATPSERGLYYGSYVQQSCNCLDARATPSGRDHNMEMHGAGYGKLVAQKTV
jgi:hypothetical protein